MNNHARLLSAVFAEPWYIEPTYHRPVAEVVHRHCFGETASTSELDKQVVSGMDFDEWVPQTPKAGIDDNGIATVPIYGVMAKRVSSIARSCGVCDTDVVRNQIAQFSKQGALGFYFPAASPGGQTLGTHELAEDIAALSVPTVSATEEIEASACFYALSGCDMKFATKSSVVGSIGTYMPWVDYGERWSAMGLKWDPIVSEGSDLKAAGGGPSLSEEHRAYLQEHVDSLNSEFKNFVVEHRNLSEDTMRGQVFTGQKSASVGLVDFIGSQQDAYDTLLGEISRQN